MRLHRSSLSMLHDTLFASQADIQAFMSSLAGSMRRHLDPASTLMGRLYDVPAVVILIMATIFSAAALLTAFVTWCRAKVPHGERQAKQAMRMRSETDSMDTETGFMDSNDPRRCRVTTHDGDMFPGKVQLPPGAARTALHDKTRGHGHGGLSVSFKAPSPGSETHSELSEAVSTIQNRSRRSGPALSSSHSSGTIGTFGIAGARHAPTKRRLPRDVTASSVAQSEVFCVYGNDVPRFSEIFRDPFLSVKGSDSEKSSPEDTPRGADASRGAA